MKAAVLGAMLAVLGWAGWSALDSGTLTASAGAPAPVAAAPERPAALALALPRDDTPAAGAAAASGAQAVERPAVPPRPESRALPVGPDGFAMQNGQLTAVRAPAVASVIPIEPVAVMLPAGVRREDAVVSPAGMVAVTRAGTAPVDVAPAPPRPPSVTHSP